MVLVLEGTTTAGAELTVTLAVASAVPPGPVATRWKLVEFAGVTVLTPEVGTSPMPSMEMVVASEVRQERTTWSPAEIADGVAVI
jgi:hypothetical protein